MKKSKLLKTHIIAWWMVVVFTIGLAACQPEVASPAGEEETLTSETAQEAPDQEQSGSPSGSQDEGQGESAVEPVTAPEESEPDPAAIEAAWKSSQHAQAFVVDAAGQNNSCAQCHAPINWQPSMDTLPESCFVCKFELEDPPPYIPEDGWDHIPCTVCHRVDRDDTIQDEIAWLEIPVLEEYIDVASPSELCLKCHAVVDIPQHGKVELVSAHADYQCTDCHLAHEATATCVSDACHSDVIEPIMPIPGHDADHQAVSCVACHDGNGMEVAPDDETGIWITFATTGSTDTRLDRFAFTSHNVVLESSCERCHFAENPWGLSVDVEIP